MNTFHLEAVNCKNCQRLCYFRQASFAWPADDPQWSESDVPPPVVACGECKHVYDYRDQKPKSIPSPEGLAPDTPDAMMRVFEETIECDELGCKAQITVIAVRKSDTTREQMKKERDQWELINLTCPEGHPYPWPPWDKGLTVG